MKTMKRNKPSLIHLLVIALLLAGCTAPAAQVGPTASVTAAVAQATEAPPCPEAPACPVATDCPAAPQSTETPAASETQQPAETEVPEPTFDPAQDVPLKDAAADLDPQDVFENFYNITQVPRPSGHLEQIRQFLVDFGNGLGLETQVDDAGNVLIRKPASPGMENLQGVVLQAHMDMVPQAADGVDFDFTTDPIQAFVNGDYIHTEGTTLGADDGIGVAVIMSLLQSQTLQAGPLEGLFTVDEETTMSGANGLQPDELKGSILINIDWETEGSFDIGSAGGGHVNVNSSYTQTPAPADMVSYQVKISGLQGGHSGVDINQGRGSATKLLVRLLKEAAGTYGLRLANLNGGTTTNAIPSEADAVVFLAQSQVEPFQDFVKEYEATIQAELAATEPDLSVQMEAVEPPAQVMDASYQSILIDALYGTPQGVIRMSDTVADLVETSTNLGITNVVDGQMQLISYPRSSVDSELDDISTMIESVWELAGYTPKRSDYFASWTPNPDSPILKLFEDTYVDLFDQQPEVTAVHAGLECGAIGATYPNMDMISIGPTLADVHTPSERLYIPSVHKLMDLLSAVLQQIPEQ
jgi:dipeptidase D